MAIAFPRALPSGVGFEPARFRLAETVAALRDRAGLWAHMETATPVWTITFTTEPMGEDQVQAFEAWRETLRGGIGRVLVTQNVTCRPLAHEADAAKAPAQDTGLVDSVNGLEVTVSGLSAALSLAPGDLVGFSSGAYRALARIAEASAPGLTARTLVFSSAPRAYAAAAGATVVFENPALVMAMDPQSFRLDDADFPRAALTFAEVKA